ncbi:MAG: ECF transporter S component [Clostridia bacterium]|nr:ECF transporter S component [Clostridia bacterium]
MPSVKKTVLTAVCMTLCVVLPQAFHMIPNAGTVFLPMHIPVLLCGLICGWSYGLLCGLTGPVLSFLLTGMPSAAILPAMMVECGLYGAITGLMMQHIKTKRLYADLYISLITAMVLSRVVSGAVKALILTPGKITLAVWVTGSFVTCLPGIIIHLVLIPTLVCALMRARLIPERYPKGSVLPKFSRTVGPLTAE